MPEVQAASQAVQEPGRCLLLDRDIREIELLLREGGRAGGQLRRSPLQSGGVPVHAGKLLQRQVLDREGAALQPEERSLPGAATGN